MSLIYGLRAHSLVWHMEVSTHYTRLSVLSGLACVRTLLILYPVPLNLILSLLLIYFLISTLFRELGIFRHVTLGRWKSFLSRLWSQP